MEPSNLLTTEVDRTIRVTVDYWLRTATWEDRQDLVQDCRLWWLTYSPEKKADAEERGLTNALVTAFVRNTWWKRLRRKREFVTAIPERSVEEEDRSPDDFTVEVLDAVGRLTERERQSLYAYACTGNYMEAGRITGRDYQVLRLDCIKARRKVIGEVNRNFLQKNLVVSNIPCTFVVQEGSEPKQQRTPQ